MTRVRSFVRVTLAALAPCLFSCQEPTADDDAAPPVDDDSAPDDDTTPPIPYPGFIEGRVVDETGAPLEGAVVEHAGGTRSAVSDIQGAYRLEIPEADLGEEPLVAAGLAGYRNGFAAELPYDAPWDVVLGTIPAVDNADYHFQPGGDSGSPTTAYCGHCHTDFADAWQTSAHRRSAENPWTFDLYNGAAGGIADAAACDAAGGSWDEGGVPGEDGTAHRCYLGPGLLPEANPGECGPGTALPCDHPSAAPTALGSCGDCHAPAQEGVPPGQLDFNRARGVAFSDGVGCDLCHKVAAVQANTRPGLDGALELRRPSKPSPSPASEYAPLMFGSHVDVLNPYMGASFQPAFAGSEFCSGCHEYAQPPLLPGGVVDAARWPEGLPVHETFTEWSESPSAGFEQVCQDCHMPAIDAPTTAGDFFSANDPGISVGWPRPFGEVRSHGFAGPLHDWGDLEPEAGPLADLAVSLAVSAERDGGAVRVEVRAANYGAGHAVPTGEPLRRLVLLVSARDASGERLPAVGGYTVPDFGSAWAEGIVGEDGVALDGDRLTLPGLDPSAAVGLEARFVRAGGTFDDYPAPARYGALGLPPEEKGMPVLEPVAAAAVVGTDGGSLLLAEAPAGVAEGDRVYLGAAGKEFAAVGDEAEAAPYAGLPGYAFAKVLVDAGGGRDVPHYRAVEVASDNRLPPGVTVSTPHVFAAPGDGGEVTVGAVLLYRPAPWGLAAERGWDLGDHVMARASVTVE